MILSPMLAAPLLHPTAEHNDDTIYKAMQQLKHWPKMVTLKEDGIRGVITGTAEYPLPQLRSRKLLLIPNEQLRERAYKIPQGLDCELCGDMSYNEVQSIVMEERADASKIQFRLIDFYEANTHFNYEERLTERAPFELDKTEVIQPHVTWCNNVDELFECERQAIQQCGEGICFRTPDSPYKFGRSTLNEEYLIKLARYVRTEVEIIGVVEQQENRNKQQTDNVGLSKRSSAQSGKTGKGTLGSFIVRDKNGFEFTVGNGVGWTNKARQNFWDHSDEFMSTILVIKHKAHGAKIAPRSPVAVGWREKGF